MIKLLNVKSIVEFIVLESQKSLPEKSTGHSSTIEDKRINQKKFPEKAEKL